MLDAFKEGQRQELAARALQDAKQRDFRLFKQAYFIALGGLCADHLRSSDPMRLAGVAHAIARNATIELHQARNRILGPQIEEIPK